MEIAGATTGGALKEEEDEADWLAEAISLKELLLGYCREGAYAFESGAED